VSRFSRFSALLESRAARALNHEQERLVASEDGWMDRVRKALRRQISAGEVRRSRSAIGPGAWVVVWILALCSGASAHAQISPGPLARAHQGLKGDSNCIKCHEVSTRAPSFKCVECHQEIGAELRLKKGLHSTFPQGGPTGSACVKCHSDHNGVDFQMIHWTPTHQGFDHSKTGYSLDGKHASVGCRDCHNASHIPGDSKAILTTKDLSRTYMGLSPTCTTCHEDKHKGRFGANCLECHNTTDWKGAKVDKEHFDHSKTRYPLTGAHRDVACQKCHTPGADGQPRYAGLQFSTCSDCHADPHKGGFKQTCESCHTTSTWKRSTFTSTFDHSKTKFPLLGKHRVVACLDCHKSANFKAPLAFANCADCHKPDPHGGQFLKRPDGGRCDSCHTVDGWKPTTFAAADHARTRFPLVSPHAKVKCADCHIPAGKATRYMIKFAACLDCHKDEHQGQFAAAPWLNRCDQCHNGATFKTTSFSLEKHQKSSFPLTGSHEAVPCNECHKAETGEKLVLYHFSRLSCTSCHEDVHKGEFASRTAKLDAHGKPLGCQACHSTKEWKDLSKFDHAGTDFPLLGSHRAVTCMDCHKPPNMELNMLHVQFKSAPKACGECHENPHADQFGARENDCAGCHNSNKWKPSLFDHEKTQFPLKGGHEGVACGACHTLKREVAGKPVLFYKPTPTTCEACHGSSVPKQKEGRPEGKGDRSSVRNFDHLRVIFTWSSLS
jgi:hypothetical protein